MLNKRGFTLIEVVVVTLIIAALAVLVAPSFKNSAVTNDMEKAKIGLVEFTNAVKLYNEVHTLKMSGVFNQTMYNDLTTDDGQGFTYLQYPARWIPGTNNRYTLAGVSCRYEFYVNNSVLSLAKCIFPKTSGEEGTECYIFKILKENPAVIKKEVSESGCDEI